MNKELLNYIENTVDDVSCFELASWYENQDHISPATSFYLKCAENTENKDLAYECFLRLYLCYRKLSNRDYTCEFLLKTALQIDSKKPEAYLFLSQFYEYKNNWQDCYLFSCLGLDLENNKPSKLRKSVGYDSLYMLFFQKALSSWWVGKPKESRFLFKKIKDDYRNQLNETYFQLVQNNLCTLGSGNEQESSVRYSKKQNNLRFKFKGYEDIEKNFSQVCQDIFVLTVLDGKKNGTYLEIGSAHSFHNSNTALLEQLGWSGLGVEYKKELVEMHEKERKNKVIWGDALSLDYKDLLKENYSSKIIDYLQLDIEPSKNTFEALLLLPMGDYQFRVITYEHDHYVDMTCSYREKSRNYLKSLGYELIIGDVAANSGCNFEDWWVKEELVNKEVAGRIKKISNKDINLISNIIF